MPLPTAASVCRPAFPLWRGSALLACLGLSSSAVFAAEPAIAAANYHKKVEPILAKYCYDCHGNGLNKGQVTLDEFRSDADILAQRELWLKALKNVRGGLMPPREEEGEVRPSEEEINTLTHWVKYEAFGIDPQNPDPGRVTVRRLNRVEYRNTIRDLMGYDFNAEVEFPSDDSGHGFDNNGDVLTLSPLHLEKYLAAAEQIVDRAVPKVSRVIRERVATGRDFRSEGGANGESMNVKRPLTVARTFHVDRTEKYQVSMELEIRGSFDFDPGRCKLVCRIDGQEKFVEDVAWQERKTLKHDFELEWSAGSHVISFEIQPLAPLEKAAAVNGASVAAVSAPAPAAPSSVEANRSPAANPDRPAGRGPRTPPATSVNVRIVSVQVRGPIDPQFWVAPENHARFFPRGPAPADEPGREAYARELLGDFARRAFRRPVEEARVTQLVALAQNVYRQPGKTFEEGVGRAMMAVLASPRFVFRVEQPDPKEAQARYARIDEFALASRLSYFLWSSMPDEELFSLAAKGELRANLRAQVARMLKDGKAQAFVRNFTGQWLQARDVESVPINARVVLGPNAPRNRDGRIEFDGAFRRMMRSETEMYFEHIIREDRSLLELVESDYTFLNDRLATHYGIPDVKGEELRLVKLPADSVRGGILTQGTVLAVTSNPTRTSPVKRGLFILENILGTPPPPAPPNVPDLEESKDKFQGREPKLSEMLAVHRENKLCNSCHERMDPLGLALENFNALGAWRDTDARQPIEASGQLVTGEKFSDVRELKRVLVRDRKMDIYRCITEKLMIYALGRGLEYYDTHTVDEIADRLLAENGRFSVLMHAIIESPAFQKQRTMPATPHTVSLSTPAHSP